MCRDAGIPLKLAVLAVPVATDFSTYQKPSDSPFPSFTEFRKGAMLNWERMSFFGDCLFQTNEEVVRASIPRYWMQPLDAPNFSGLCETFLITAECDPVRDEGEAYGRKVHEAGAKVAFKRSVFFRPTFFLAGTDRE
jgi:acetyl esterase/lipase